MSVIRWRKKPIEFDAIQWTGDNLEEMRAFCGTREIPTDEAFDIDANQPYIEQAFNPIGTFIVLTEEGSTGELWVAANGRNLPLENGEWVIKDSLGFYPCKDEIIKQNNDPIGVGDE